jgi:hypothetical protein
VNCGVAREAHTLKGEPQRRQGRSQKSAWMRASLLGRPTGRGPTGPMNGPMGQLLDDHKQRAVRTLIAHHSTVELTALMAVSRPPIDQRGPARAGCQQGSVA